MAELRALQQDADAVVAALADPARAVLERTLRANLVEFDLALIAFSRRRGRAEGMSAPEHRVGTFL